MPLSTSSGSARNARSVGSSQDCPCLNRVQRDSTVVVSSGPTPYGSGDGPNKAAPILQLDCRGLELLDFKPEVRLSSF